MNTETMEKLQSINLLKTEAEIAKLMVATAKLNKETRWYEVGVIVAATLAVVAIVKLFLV